MEQQTSEQEWQQLKHRISGMLDRFLKEDILEIEHKSNVTALLSAPPEYMNISKMENAE
jgi:hypothetical protein